MFKVVGILFSLLVLLLSIYLLRPDSINPEQIVNRRVLVTGASQNIGKHIALEFAKLGAHVVVTARNEKKLQEVVQLCLENGASSAHYIQADMNQLDETKDVIVKAVELLGGGLDYLILNHAFTPTSRDLWNGTQADFDYLQKAMNVNFMSFVHLSSHAAPYLSESNGYLGIVSSLAGHVTTPYSPAYSSTKAAINSFYSVLRVEGVMKEEPPTYSTTICLLGFIDTVRGSGWEKTITVKTHPVGDTAREIIASTSKRRPYVYVPTWGMVSGLMRIFTTDWFDSLLVKYTYSSD